MHPLASSKRKENGLKFFIELDEVDFKKELLSEELSDKILLSLLQKDFEELDLEGPDTEAFLRVIGFYMSPLDFEDWYASLD